jgi:2'-5' RNA ligase
MRSFIAVNLPQTVKDEIDGIVSRLRPAGPPARWVPGDNMHLTLKFLDEITEDQVVPLRDAIVSVAGALPAFEVTLSGFGVFPNEQRARIFWVGIEQGFDTLKTLARDIDRAIAPLGFPRENRPFSAHVTLARLREPGPVDRLIRAASHVPYNSGAIRVASVELMRSVLSPKGAQYSVLESVRIGS